MLIYLCTKQIQVHVGERRDEHTVSRVHTYALCTCVWEWELKKKHTWLCTYYVIVMSMYVTRRGHTCTCRWHFDHHLWQCTKQSRRESMCMCVCVCERERAKERIYTWLCTYLYYIMSVHVIQERIYTVHVDVTSITISDYCKTK